MRTKLTTILAAVVFVALGVANSSHTNAKQLEDYRTTPAMTQGQVAPAAVVPQGSPGFANNRGRIKRIYPEPTGVYFAFGGNPGEWQTAMNPANGYYFIPMSHPNYKTLVDLLYLAAEHDWNLQARTQPTLGIGGRADVIYLVQDFVRQ